MDAQSIAAKWHQSVNVFWPAITCPAVVLTYCEGNADIVDCNVDILFLLDVLSDCKRLILVCAELIFNSAPPIRVVNPLIETVLLFKFVFNVFVDVLSVFIFEYTSLKLVSYNPSLLLVDHSVMTTTNDNNRKQPLSLNMTDEGICFFKNTTIIQNSIGR